MLSEEFETQKGKVVPTIVDVTARQITSFKSCTAAGI